MSFDFLASSPDWAEFFARRQPQLIVEVRRTGLRRVAGTEGDLRTDRVGELDGCHIRIATGGIESSVRSFVKINRAEDSKWITGAAVGWQINFATAKTVYVAPQHVQLPIINFDFGGGGLERGDGRCGIGEARWSCAGRFFIPSLRKPASPSQTLIQLDAKGFE